MTIETYSPEIGVEQLAQKLREEIARQHLSPSTTAPEVPPKGVESRELAIAAPVDTSAIAGQVSYVEGFINTAGSRAQVRSDLPQKFKQFPFILLRPFQCIALKILSILFKDQREVNFNILTALRESLQLNQELLAQVESLRSRAESDLHQLHLLLQDLSGYVRIVEANLGNTATQFQDQLQQVDRNGGEAIAQLQKELQKQLQQLEQRGENTHSWLQQLEQREANTHSWLQQLEQRGEEQKQDTIQKIQSLERQIKESDERNFQDKNYLKGDLIQQKRMITMFLQEVRQRLPEPLTPDQLQAFSNELDHSLDAFYVAFEDRFRGSRELIHKRLEVYLPLLEKTQIAPSDSLILDLACGRGEWLELLKENHYRAIGVDINKAVIEQCRTRGLEAIEADLMDYLKTVPDASVAVVTGFHIIEHLPLATLMELLSETLRVLRYGGLVIFETPNPANILVGSCYFYADPTHRNPLPGATTQFLAEYAGFSEVKLLYLNPSIETPFADESELAQRLNGYFYGPMDYAIVGRKLME